MVMPRVIPDLLQTNLHKDGNALESTGQKKTARLSDGY
jgi:hypothetical protein